MKRIGYPLLFTLLLLLMALPARAQFGAAVAVGEDVVFASEPTSPINPGTVYVFQKGDEGWAETGQIFATDGEAGDGFGNAISLDGDRMIVGASNKHAGGGAAYIFERSESGGWMEVAHLMPSDGAEGDNFGIAVGISGDFALVGAYAHNDRTGAAYMYHRGADGTWTQHSKVMGSDIEMGNRYGVVLALDGDKALIGATRKNSAKGAVYAFNYDEATNTWIEQGQLEASNLESDNRFGSEILLQGNHALVSTPRQSRFTGAVYMFKYDEEEGGWSESGKLLPFDGGQQFRFGTALGASESEVWVAAPGASQFSGRVYRLSMDHETGEWTSAVKFTAEDLAPRTFFGGMMDMNDNLAVVSVPGADNGAGTAVIFAKDDAGAWQQEATVASEMQGFDPITGGQVKCEEGSAAAFECSDVDIVSFLPLKDVGGTRGTRMNDVWGWTDEESGKEYVIAGRNNGTAFIDISDPFNPVYLGSLPKTEGSPAATWRDMKVYKNHAFIVADGSGSHGMQIFDLTRLRDVTTPQTFEEDAHYSNIHSAHNIVINEETGFAYAVGASSGGETCGGGLHMINIQEPQNPQFVGCFADSATGRASTGYSHDAQCVVYQGPDLEHQGKEICMGANETALSIADVTDKDNPVAISSAAYPNVGYSHQGWFTEDHRYFYMNDELDEIGGNVTHTRTLVWDVADLDDPQLIKEHLSESKASDHNLYIKGNLMYQSNYVSGLRIFDISDPENPVEVGFLDTVPYGENEPGFSGSWSNYPFFESGVIAVTSGNEGVFIVKKKDVDI